MNLPEAIIQLSNIYKKFAKLSKLCAELPGAAYASEVCIFHRLLNSRWILCLKGLQLVRRHLSYIQMQTGIETARIARNSAVPGFFFSLYIADSESRSGFLSQAR